VIGGRSAEEKAALRDMVHRTVVKQWTERVSEDNKLFEIFIAKLYHFISFHTTSHHEHLSNHSYLERNLFFVDSFDLLDLAPMISDGMSVLVKVWLGNWLFDLFLL